MAVSVIESIVADIENMDLDTAVILQSGFDNELNKYEDIHSNIKRELVYNLEHAIHHMAIIRIGVINIAPEIELSEGFGIAPSTIKYYKSLKAD